MNKTIKLIVTGWALLLLAGCNTLDIENISDYDADRVWSDEKLADAYIVNLYANTFDNWNPSADVTSQQLNGIHFYEDRITITNEEYKRWDYDKIRLINRAIQKITDGKLPEEVKKRFLGQVFFLRAYVYFGMVSYHGGVPYITVPQDKDKDDLYVKRNSTGECFDNIVADIERALLLLPEKVPASSNDYGRIDQCFAAAFKAKVLLNKASPQFNPKNPWGNAYWAEAHRANKAAYDLLVKNGAALVEQYEDVFLKERNAETVFAVINSYPNKMANWDHGVRPGSESRGNAWACPTWEFVKEFPMLDGKASDDPAGKYYLDSVAFVQAYWKNRDPRFDKSLVWNAGIYEVSQKKGNRQYTALGIAHEADDFGINPKANVNSTNLNTYSGFFIRKASNLALLQSQVQQYDIDYVVMRFAEVMLNYAETANETGDQSTALDILKAIRKRAGIEAGADGNYGIAAASREEVREAIVGERNIEFCFEGHRYADLRRLRMLDRLDKQTKHGVEAIAINPDGTDMPMDEAKRKASENALEEKDFRYTVLQIPFSGVKVTSVPEKYYFYPIQNVVIEKNNKIEQNAGWGGTFNPTLE